MEAGKAIQVGDRVVHPRRLEWGEGIVDRVMSISHEGKPALRVTVHFAHHGTVTINTAVSPLLHKEESTMSMSRSPSATAPTPSSGPPAAPSGGWLGSLSSQNPQQNLTRLPEAMTDPFKSPAKRLEATLDSFRYTADPRNPRQLLDWAIAQTGLPDPLSKYTRHELEQALPRFVRDRDNHLFDLVRGIKRSGSTEAMEEVLRKTTHPAARAALQKAMQR